MEPSSGKKLPNESTPLLQGEGSIRIVSSFSTRISQIVRLVYHTPGFIYALFRAYGYCTLGLCYSSLYNHWENISSLDFAIKSYKNALALIPEGRRDHAAVLDLCGSLYFRRYEVLREEADVWSAQGLHFQVVNQPFLTFRNAPQYFDHLGWDSLAIFQRHGEVEHIEYAVKCLTHALLWAPEGHFYRIVVLVRLAIVYLFRYNRFHEASDFEKWIDYAKQSNLLLPKAPKCFHKMGSSIRSHIPMAYGSRFERFGDISDLNHAIALQNQIHSELPKDDPARHEAGTLLGNMYTTLFEHTGQLEALQKSISYNTEGILHVPDRGLAAKHNYVYQTSLPFIRRFEYLGSLSDIDEAAAHFLQGISSCPTGDIVGRAYLLSGLGYVLVVRYQRLNDLADLDQAITYYNEANSLLYREHTLKGTCLDQLGLTYQERFGRLGHLGDLDNAMSHHLEALSLIPERHTKRPSCLSSLAKTYLCNFTTHHRATDLKTAIQYQTQAVSSVSLNHTHRPIYLDLLGTMYERQFTLSNQLPDIEQSVEYLKQAVSLSQDEYPLKPLFLFHLATSYYARLLGMKSDPAMVLSHNNPSCGSNSGAPGAPISSQQVPNPFSSPDHEPLSSNESKGYRMIIECFQSAAQFSSGSPVILFRAARSWAWLSLASGVSSPLTAYRRLLELLPNVVWLGTTVYRRHEDILEIGDCILEAAAVAIENQEYDLAFEWLEEGRSIVWKQMLQLRTPLDDLSLVDEELAKKLRWVAQSLELAGQSNAFGTDYSSTMVTREQQAHKHRGLAAQWDQLLGQARALPGFENFLRPRTTTSLLRAAHSHPVVAINVHSRHCDALIIQPGSDRVTHVPLPGFSHSKAVNLWNGIMSSLGQSDVRARQERRPVYPEQVRVDHFRDILATLWADIVKPVLEHCGFMRSKLPVRDLPRIIWCTTGLLSFLPIHAAGDYSDPDARIFNYVVSSYTPTVSALLSDPPSPGNPVKLLAVGQAETAGYAALPGTIKELDKIRRQASVLQFTQLDGDKATTTATLNSMKDHNWVHLACHASQSTVAPSLSAFHLHDGTLDLATIMKQSFKNRGLAFLSACQTARGDEKLTEEAVHLAAGMIMAGYPTVIATMWSIRDEDAPVIAEKVYAHLLRDGVPDSRDAARALHIAVKHLREAVGEENFSWWAPFIHIGV
ncbi:hypothetical protein FRC09_000653 [Ceratobasidium sp. 395]|nr:hypothetical protein FRC09_000653 [Ceratobasidium sp. 395]